MQLSVYRGGLPFGPAPAAPLGYALGQSDAGRNLQNALNVLASIVNDPKIAVKVDGVIGKNTAAAYNRAAKNYLSIPPPKGRTGKLSLAIVKKYAPRFTGFVRGEIELRQQKDPAQAAAPAPKPSTSKPAKPAPAKTAAATTLQAAVRSLGKRTNDSALLIKVDGVVGPKTKDATNRALTRYATEAPAELRTGKLTSDQIKTNAAQIAVAIEQAARDAKPQAAPAAPTAPAVSKAAVQRLQTALRQLGQLTNNATLRIAVDGIVGPRTARAASKAVGRTLSVAQVKNNVDALATQVETVVAQTKAAPQAAPTAPPAAPAPGVTPRIAVARLQRALADLGALLGDPILQIRADGVAGPKTAAAVTRAMRAYVRNKPASMAQPLTPAQIAIMAEALSTQVESELAQRRADVLKKTPEPETAPRAEREAMPTPSPAPQLPVPRATPSYEPTYAPDAAPPPPEKKLHWGWIAGGAAAALLVGGLTVAAFSKRSRRLAPA